jgi:hypothetical protein
MLVRGLRLGTRGGCAVADETLAERLAELRKCVGDLRDSLNEMQRYSAEAYQSAHNLMFDIDEIRQQVAGLLLTVSSIRTDWKTDA